MQSDFRDWSDVRVFLAVVRAGSTLAASKGLGMAQPTVARRIEALEHALGLVLFERDTRGFQPTAEAQALIEAAHSVEAATTDFPDGPAADRRQIAHHPAYRIQGGLQPSPCVGDRGLHQNALATFSSSFCPVMSPLMLGWERSMLRSVSPRRSTNRR